ncbi:uncharacterized protein E0L32_010767 [Thyridium curvatum]|uniref:Ribosome biogenesis protein Urb1 n=1 Tax=Thyridium curvatum TaxID=1093900 RepID=A0A507ADX5_9PEZI|nr:uncharacterized protein E0L32_010767 [Thyridium curvatum]TPX07345.1 hypothetical protein E0L32_010767 [Thyridium curvatum]
MAKRKPRGPEGENPRKRVRIVHEAPTFEEIHAARQLKQLLTFDQDLQKARHGLQSLKVFLDTINDADTRDPEKMGILKDFLEASRPRGDDTSEDAVYLSELMETWSFAAQVNNENIMSAVPVALALLLKIVSQTLDLTPHGLGICRTLLHKRQQELLARNLSADKSKEFIISPTLRLVREAISFDGGVVAKAIFRARSYTYKSLARNMTVKFLGDGLEDGKRPSARTNAIRFFLSSLKFLHAEAKAELLSQKDLVTALTKTLKDDPPYLIIEMLECLKKSVMMDRKVPRIAKSRLLSSMTLSRIAGLYHYHHETQQGDGVVAVDDAAHSFLVHACTTPNAGVLRDQTGFYPKGLDLGQTSQGFEDSPEAGLAKPVLFDQVTGDVPVENIVLFDFIQALRPWSNSKQSDLVIAIFKAAPEIVAGYFISKKSFTFEPKLSATWIGYAALLFSTIQIPIPRFFGAHLTYARSPPPTSILIDNILPLPLTQKVLTRSLSQKSNLVSFFATRLLVIALQKLRQALRLHREAVAMGKASWTASSRRLVDEFCQRCPNMRDAFNAYRTIPPDDLLHREAASRLLRLYYEIIPQAAFSARIDVSPLLAAVLQQLENAGQSSEDKALRLLELENLLVIAGHSPGMRWFSKSDTLAFSPFTSLLKVCVGTDEYTTMSSFGVLDLVAREQQLVWPNPNYLDLAPLMESLRQLKRVKPTALEHVWPFIDNCAARCTATPIKYLEVASEIQINREDTRPMVLSPLWLAIMEQVPFLSGPNGDAHAAESIARFIVGYAGFSESAGEDAAALGEVIKRISDSLPLESKKRRSAKAGKASMRAETRRPAVEVGEEDVSGSTETARSKSTEIDQESLEDMLATPDSVGSDNAALSRWVHKDADELVEEGHAAALVQLLSSEHTSIRKEALTNVMKMAAKIRESTYEEKEQIWLLLAELAESSKGFVDEKPLPSHIVAFACGALKVLKNPLHCLYAKVNAFLTAGPVWNLDKFPLVYEILQEGPSNDDAYYAEVSWLLAYLLESLRTPADLFLVHGKRLFERLLALTANPYARQPVRMQVLRIVYRATAIKGGSDTLVTRFGLISWLESQTAKFSGEEEAKIYKALLRRVWNTCDQERVRQWSQGGIDALLD